MFGFPFCLFFVIDFIISYFPRLLNFIRFEFRDDAWDANV